MTIPSYDDLTPPIPDVVSSESVTQLALFLRDLQPLPRARRVAEPSVAPPAMLYACLSDDGSQEAEGRKQELERIARDFSPRVMRASDHEILLDVSGLGRLIGEPAAIAAEIDRTVREAGLRARVAIAPTQTAARILCRPAVSGPAIGGVTHVVVSDVAPALAPLPVGSLQSLEVLPPGMNVRDRVRPYEIFESWGIATLGDLAALPAAELSSRLGRRGTALQRLARGLDARPFVPDGKTPRYLERLELEWPIDGLEPLSFVLARLLDPLATALERADRGAAAVHLDLRLTDRSSHARVLQLPAPMRDARILRTLLLLDLESHPPFGASEGHPPSRTALRRDSVPLETIARSGLPRRSSGRSGERRREVGNIKGAPPSEVMIDIVTIEVDPAPARITQFSLLERALPSPETLSTLTARLSALVGESRVGAPALVDTHQPGAFEMRRFQPESPARDVADPHTPDLPPSHEATAARHSLGDGGKVGPAGDVVMRRQRVPPAIRVNVERGRPVFLSASHRGMPSGAVTQAAGPWRTSGGWWCARDRPPDASLLLEGGRHGNGESACGPREGPEGSAAQRRPRARASGGAAPPAMSNAWNRDEWDVALAGGAICRIFQDRSTGRWFLDGTYD
jgi:nucleotidyltransferase/DNA polymerase involved in DNA repair